MFLVFKQYYTNFYTLFHPHIFPKKIENYCLNTRTKQILGHPSEKILHSTLSFLETLDALNKTFDIVTHCRHCLSGKMHQLHFNKSNSISTNPLKLIYSDVWVPETYNFCEWLQIFTLFLLMTFLNSLGFICLNSSLMPSTFLSISKPLLRST